MLGPNTLHAVADAIGWALAWAGAPLQIHYLDNFIFFLPPRVGYNTAVLEFILDRLSGLGVPVAMHKVEGPATTVTFFEIAVDTARMELWLQAKKITLTLALVRQWKGRRSWRYSDFESFLSHLSHAATVIHQGQTFLKHLFDILAGATLTTTMSTWTIWQKQTFFGGNIFCSAGMARCSLDTV